MYTNNKKSSKFPDPLASSEEKQGKEYGLSYAKSVYHQWGNLDNQNSIFRNRKRVFEKNRKYANGTQDTTIYKSLLTSLDPNNGDGSMVNLDFTPVPILPKFVRIVVNKILSLSPYPNLEAVDPISSSEKDKERRKLEMLISAKAQLKKIEDKTGVVIGADSNSIPDTLEEAEIFIGNNIKSSSEIAAQLATNLTLEWNDFNEGVLRRSVNDLTILGMAVVKRSNDPNYGIKTDYIDPIDFVHSFTDDPNFSDLVYAGHVKRLPIQELKRLAGDEFTEDEYKKIAAQAQQKYGYDRSKLEKSSYDRVNDVTRFGYDEYIIEVLDFEFMSVDCEYYESKENRYGNVGFYAKGENYKAPRNSVFNREVTKLETSSVYGGCYILGTDFIFNYGKKNNVPRNIHDITRTNLSYSVCATNILDMMPKSMVDSCIGFADQLQLTHLKIQQAVAKAKPDGIIIDIEGLENVQLGKGGELQPLDLHDIYEQTGVFYYRSKNPEGGFQNPPIREIGNSIRNINELIGLYNHYLKMIRDATGINEVMDASSPKTDALVGVRNQALAAANNAIYDITNSSMVLYKKVCSDIVKCIQIIHPDSILYAMYENAIGKENMSLLNSFRDLAMYNFGVRVVKEMEEAERQYLEQNIQIALSQKEIDLEDAIAVRQLKDINQAERLLVVRRKKRMAQQQQIAMQNSQQQAEIQQSSAKATSEAKQQEMQLAAQLKAQELQLKAQLEAQLEEVKHGFNKEIEMIKAEAYSTRVTTEKDFKAAIETMKDDRKDERVKKQAVEQSKLISQRDGKRGELTDESAPGDVTSEILG